MIFLKKITDLNQIFMILLYIKKGLDILSVQRWFLFLLKVFDVFHTFWIPLTVYILQFVFGHHSFALFMGNFVQFSEIDCLKMLS